MRKYLKILWQFAHSRIWSLWNKRSGHGLETLKSNCRKLINKINNASVWHLQYDTLAGHQLGWVMGTLAFLQHNFMLKFPTEFRCPVVYVIFVEKLWINVRFDFLKDGVACPRNEQHRGVWPSFLFHNQFSITSAHCWKNTQWLYHTEK